MANSRVTNECYTNLCFIIRSDIIVTRISDIIICVSWFVFSFMSDYAA